MEEFIAKSKNSKEILNSAQLLQSVEINALISGQPGVGKKSLAKYILPEAKIYKAKTLQDDISDNIISLSNESIISTYLVESRSISDRNKLNFSLDILNSFCPIITFFL